MNSEYEEQAEDEDGYPNNSGVPVQIQDRLKGGMMPGGPQINQRRLHGNGPIRALHKEDDVL